MFLRKVAVRFGDLPDEVARIKGFLINEVKQASCV